MECASGHSAGHGGWGKGHGEVTTVLTEWGIGLK
jgi:hypothetical protein